MLRVIRDDGAVRHVPKCNSALPTTKCNNMTTSALTTYMAHNDKHQQTLQDQRQAVPTHHRSVAVPVSMQIAV